MHFVCKAFLKIVSSYNWNIVESDVKHHKPTTTMIVSIINNMNNYKTTTMASSM
jgi:hypothetical protein